MENHNFLKVNPLFLWPCSIAFVCLPEGKRYNFRIPSGSPPASSDCAADCARNEASGAALCGVVGPVLLRITGEESCRRSKAVTFAQKWWIFSGELTVCYGIVLFKITKSTINGSFSNLPRQDIYIYISPFVINGIFGIFWWLIGILPTNMGILMGMTL